MVGAPLKWLNFAQNIIMETYDLVHCCSRQPPKHEVKHLHSVFHCVETLLTNGALYLSGKGGECSWKSGVLNNRTVRGRKNRDKTGLYRDVRILISHKSYNICLVRYILLKALWSGAIVQERKAKVKSKTLASVLFPLRFIAQFVSCVIFYSNFIDSNKTRLSNGNKSTARELYCTYLLVD